MENSPVMYFTLLIIMLLAIVFFITDRMLSYLQHHNSDILHQKGKRVVAIVTNIRQETEERGPAQFPHINYCYYIEAEWTDIKTGRTYQFMSKRLNSRPIEEAGAFLSVVVDLEQPTNYEMDLSEEHR